MPATVGDRRGVGSRLPTEAVSGSGRSILTRLKNSMGRKLVLIVGSAAIVATAFVLTLMILNNGFAATLMGLERLINP